MKTALLVVVAVVSGATFVAQEKPIPKDSLRIFVPGCARGTLFIAGERTEDQPGRSDVPPGMRLRMNGPKKLMADLKAHQETMVEITGLIRKGQFEPGGVAIGGNVRVGPAPSTLGANAGRDPNPGQILIDVEGWRQIVGECRTR